MLRLLLILPILLISCKTIKALDPKSVIYEIYQGKPCYYETVQDLADGKVICKEYNELEGWKVIHTENLRKVMLSGIDELIDTSNRRIQVKKQINKPTTKPTTNFNNKPKGK